MANALLARPRHDVPINAPASQARPVLLVVTTPQPAPAPRADTGIHPLTVAIPIAAFAWFILVSWIAFGSGDAIPVLAVITIFGIIYFGLIAGGGAFAYDPLAGQSRQRSFKEFLHGEVEIATGRIPGREAFLQITFMPVALAIGGTVIVACAVGAGI